MAEPTATTPWDDETYQRIASAAGSGHDLDIVFENGDHVQVDARALFGADAGASVRWDTLIVDPFELRIEHDGGLLELPWLDVRALADERLAAHLAERADAGARQVGGRLRTLRERRRLTARQLSDRAGISPQSLSRIERGRHDVVFSTLLRLLAAMNYELADLAALDQPEIAPERVRAILAATGLQRDTIERLLFGARDSHGLLVRLRNIFGWSATDLAGPGPPPLLSTPALAGRFKDQTRTSRAAATYVLYAHKLALLADQAADRPAYRPPPNDPHELRRQVTARYGDLRFASVAQFCWDNGIVVVPLIDHAQFHGACWLVDGRPIIVLKQINALDSRWVFDLCHEIAHIALHLHAGVDAIVELGAIGEQEHEREETEASDYASDALLGDPDGLAHAVAAAAGNVGPRVWKSIPGVARDADVDVGVLANYMARRLVEEKIFPNAWGPATELQAHDTGAPSAARRLLLEHLNLEALASDDAEVLHGALTDTDGDET